METYPQTEKLLGGGDGVRRVRIPNAERSASTREKLLNATVECLYEYGYFATSTVAVTERAGVSRGSMLHHFPSKADLMMATCEYITALRREARRRKLDAMPNDRERFLALIDVFWGEYKQPSGLAWVEIKLGCRSDPDLAPRFRIYNQQMEEAHKGYVRALVERLGVIEDSQLNGFLMLYHGAVRGLAIDALWSKSQQDIEAGVRLLKAFQVHMLDTMLPKV